MKINHNVFAILFFGCGEWPRRAVGDNFSDNLKNLRKRKRTKTNKQSRRPIILKIYLFFTLEDKQLSKKKSQELVKKAAYL